MISLTHLFSGFLSILMVMRGHFIIAAWLIVLSLILDSLDGHIARSFECTSLFGRELDSLADVVSFVVTPAVFTFGILFAKISPWFVLVLFFYLAGGTLRLARYNVTPSGGPHFEGLPTPAAAVTLTMTLLACLRDGWMELPLCLAVVLLLILAISYLMFSHVPYPKFSAMKFSMWKPFFYFELLILVLLSWWISLETGAAVVFLIYLFLSPVYCLHLNGLPSDNKTEAAVKKERGGKSCF